MDKSVEDKIIELLKAKAAEKHPADTPESFMIDDVAGGNVDDAFWSGSSFGEITFARQVLKLLK